MAQELPTNEVLSDDNGVDKVLDDLASASEDQQREIVPVKNTQALQNEEARRMRASKLKESQQLQMSYWGRHPASNEALIELLRNKPEDQKQLNVLVAGLGRLEEVIEYVAAYKSAHNGSLEGLNLTCLDILDKESISALLDQEGVFELGDIKIGNGFINTPRKPSTLTQAGFELMPDGRHYAAAADVREFIASSIEQGVYLTSISEPEELEEAGLLRGQFDFVSANNILHYVPAEEAPATLNNLAGIVNQQGLISIADDGGSNQGRYIEFHSGGRLQAVDQSDAKCAIFKAPKKDMI